MLTYRLSNIFGYAVSASENVPPAWIVSEIPVSASVICGSFIWRFRTSMPRISGRPAFTSVASWRVNCVSTFVLILPRIQLGSLMLMFALRPPFFFGEAAFAGAALPFFLGAAAAAGAEFLTSPSAVGKSPCALTAAIAELRSPASTCPRVSLPAESLAMY